VWLLGQNGVADSRLESDVVLRSILEINARIMVVKFGYYLK